MESLKVSLFTEASKNFKAAGETRKTNFHDDMEKILQPVTDKVDDVPEQLIEAYKKTTKQASKQT